MTWLDARFARLPGSAANQTRAARRTDATREPWRRRIGACCLALPLLTLLGLAAATAAEPDPPIAVRIGDHPGFGRIVFDLPGPVSWRLARDGERATLRFAPAIAIAAAATLPRNVLGIAADADGVEITMVPGAELRSMRLGDRLVLDVLDPSPANLPARRQARLPADTLPARPAYPLDRHGRGPTAPPVPAASLPPAPAVSAAAAPKPPSAAAPPPARAPLPAPTAGPAGPAGDTTISLAATRLSPPPSDTASAILFPFGPTVGAAAFRRHGKAVLVFDQARPLDLSALRDDPVFGAAVVHVLPSATMVLLPLGAGMQPTLRHERDGWRVTVGPVQATAPPLMPAEQGGGIVFPLHATGRTITVVDPDSGATVLVGTTRQSVPPIAVGRKAPQFVLWPSWQGVAVEPLSDRLTLRALPTGFALTPESGSLSITPTTAETTAIAGALGLTRRFDLPPQPIAALAERLHRQLGAAGAAPPLSRGAKLTAAATTLIALGMGVEAMAELRLAALTMPQQADEPTQAGLGAVAALLAWRPQQAGAIDEPLLSGSDEVTLWRAVHDAELHVAMPKAASEFAATWPLILTYRWPLRQRLLPLAAETMVAGGATAPVRALLSGSPNNASLGLARGMLAQSDGQPDAALAIYDALSSARDRLVRVRAARRAVELRLAGGKITVAQAADGLEKLLVAWRGDWRDLALRERVAELRAQAGGWRAALALLRGTAVDFPEHAADLHQRMQRIFAAALADPRSDALPPLEFVALINENTDVLPAGPGGDALTARLADRLLALDLPEQAAPLLQKLMRAAPPGAGRAGIGARLAALRLRQGDTAGSLGALAESAADNLPAALRESRTLLLAKAEARNGDVQGAVAALSALATAAADETRAGILERAQDWAGAESALKDYVARTVPGAGTLDDAQRGTLIRLAAAAARGGDQAELAALRAQDLGRMGKGPLPDMFRLLTADAVHDVADLRRSGQETMLAHALPEDLKAVR